jgi:hypothetical protein
MCHERLWRFIRCCAAIALSGLLLPAVVISASPAGTRSSTPPDPYGERLDPQSLLRFLGEKATVYREIALRFVCIESIRGSDEPSNVRQYDYMYVEAQAQRYKPYRQKHTGRPGRRPQETRLDLFFPDSYSWTLIFDPERQHLFKFEYVGQEWFSLRLAHVLEFTAPLPFTSGKTVYEWSGRVWVDAENFNFLKVEAAPGNQRERLRRELKRFRQAPRFLIFPLAKRPFGSFYSITFLNEFQKLSLPDQAEFRQFTLDLEGTEEWGERLSLRYSGYQFFDVDVEDRFLR